MKLLIMNEFIVLLKGEGLQIFLLVVDKCCFAIQLYDCFPVSLIVCAHYLRAAVWRIVSVVLCIHCSDQTSGKQVIISSFPFRPPFHHTNSCINSMHQMMLDLLLHNSDAIITFKWRRMLPYIAVYFMPICCYSDCFLRWEAAKCVY